MNPSVTTNSNKLALAIIGLAMLANTSCFGDSKKRPDLWPKTGVYENKINLVKSRVFFDPEIGEITDIKYGDLDPSPGKEIVVSGEAGAVILKVNGELIKKIIFKPQMNKRKEGNKIVYSQIIDMDGDGKCEFLLAPYYYSSEYPGVMDHDGTPIWEYSKNAKGAVVADINNDGYLETLVTTDSADIDLLDRDGKLIWTKYFKSPDNALIEDINGDGKKEIILTVNDKEPNSHLILLINEHGQVTSKFKIDKKVKDNYFNGFDIVKFPEYNNRPMMIFSKNDDKTVITEFDGKTVVAEFNETFLHDDDAEIVVRLSADSPHYLAIYGRANIQGGQFVGFAKVMSRLRIYDSKWALAYKEILNDAGIILAAVPGAKPGAECILVGELNTVWKYCVSDAPVQVVPQSPPPSTKPATQQ